VQECIDYLDTNFGAIIQEEIVRKESVHFPLPRSLRQLLPSESSAAAAALADYDAMTEAEEADTQAAELS
jgi:hypothetical protein